MSRLARLSAATALALVLLGGAAPAADAASTPQPVPAAKLQTPRPFLPATAKALRATHAGRPWVLVLWSVECEPCRRELADWAAWRRQRPDVAVEWVSTDDPAQAATVERLLAAAGLGGENGRQWIFADDTVERLRHAVDPGWHGELPRTLFYAADGRVSARSGVVDGAWLAAWYAAQPESR